MKYICPHRTSNNIQDRCGFEAATKTQFFDHLIAVHEIAIRHVCNPIFFNSENELHEWIEKTIDDSNARFSRSRTRCRNDRDAYYLTYRCRRRGFTANGMIRRGGKIEGHCPAELHAYINNNKRVYHVKYQPVHVGHITWNDKNGPKITVPKMPKPPKPPPPPRPKRINKRQVKRQLDLVERRSQVEALLQHLLQQCKNVTQVKRFKKALKETADDMEFTLPEISKNREEQQDENGDEDSKDEPDSS